MAIKSSFDISEISEKVTGLSSSIKELQASFRGLLTESERAGQMGGAPVPAASSSRGMLRDPNATHSQADFHLIQQHLAVEKAGLDRIGQQRITEQNGAYYQHVGDGHGGNQMRRLMSVEDFQNQKRRVVEQSVDFVGPRRSEMGGPEHIAPDATTGLAAAAGGAGSGPTAQAATGGMGSPFASTYSNADLPRQIAAQSEVPKALERIATTIETLEKSGGERDKDMIFALKSIQEQSIRAQSEFTQALEKVKGTADLDPMDPRRLAANDEMRKAMLGMDDAEDAIKSAQKYGGGSGSGGSKAGGLLEMIKGNALGVATGAIGFAATAATAGLGAAQAIDSNLHNAHKASMVAKGQAASASFDLARSEANLADPENFYKARADILFNESSEFVGMSGVQKAMEAELAESSRGVSMQLRQRTLDSIGGAAQLGTSAATMIGGTVMGGPLGTAVAASAAPGAVSAAGNLMRTRYGSRISALDGTLQDSYIAQKLSSDDKEAFGIAAGHAQQREFNTMQANAVAGVKTFRDAAAAQNRDKIMALGELQKFEDLERQTSSMAGNLTTTGDIIDYYGNRMRGGANLSVSLAHSENQKAERKNAAEAAKLKGASKSAHEESMRRHNLVGNNTFAQAGMGTPGHMPQSDGGVDDTGSNLAAQKEMMMARRTAYAESFQGQIANDIEDIRNYKGKNIFSDEIAAFVKSKGGDWKTTLATGYDANAGGKRMHVVQQALNARVAGGDTIGQKDTEAIQKLSAPPSRYEALDLTIGEYHQREAELATVLDRKVGYKDVKNLTDMSRAGVGSAQALMSNMTAIQRATGDGDSHGKLEEIMTRAVASGFENSRLAQTFAQATTGIAESLKMTNTSQVAEMVQTNAAGFSLDINNADERGLAAAAQGVASLHSATSQQTGFMGNVNAVSAMKALGGVDQKGFVSLSTASVPQLQNWESQLKPGAKVTDPTLKAWIDRSGKSKEELRAIFKQKRQSVTMSHLSRLNATDQGFLDRVKGMGSMDELEDVIQDIRLTAADDEKDSYISAAVSLANDKGILKGKRGNAFRKQMNKGIDRAKDPKRQALQAFTDKIMSGVSGEIGDEIGSTEIDELVKNLGDNDSIRSGGAILRAGASDEEKQAFLAANKGMTRYDLASKTQSQLKTGKGQEVLVQNFSDISIHIERSIERVLKNHNINLNSGTGG